MKFFLTLLTVSFASLAGEVVIVATVNQMPITNVDMEDREEILATLMPEYVKYSSHERRIFAMQHLVQDALKQEYLKRIDFKITEEEQKQAGTDCVSMIKNAGVKDAQAFGVKYPSFMRDEITWQGFVNRTIKPAINITDDIVNSVHAQKPEIAKDKLRMMLIEQQVQSHTSQIIESVRNISVIEIKSE